jgi:tetratricopeptide (TPR) repeat protein
MFFRRAGRGVEAMRRLLVVPTVFLLGAAPIPPAPFVPATHWCGDPIDDSAHPEILPGYGGGGFTIRTKSPQAQAFFNNGMQLAHAFAHKAAIAAFQEARRLDPGCAMCAWGEAWSSGPTINYPISNEDQKKVAEIAAKAVKLAQDGPANERALIAALVLRYPASGKGDKAFAEAMDAMASANPGDDEIAVLAADALMIAADYDARKMARPVALLETVLKRSPDYTPAIHFYIHATEIAGFPERATPYADKLATLAPASSHLVHMPAHTFYWIGRYGDAATTNVRAVEISNDNAKRLKLTGPDERWTLPYYGHNVSFGIAGALMANDAKSGLALSQPLIEMAKRTPKIDTGRQMLVGKAYVATARFAAPDEMLALPDPGDANPAAQAMWHYARGEALARKGDADGVLREAKALPSNLKPDPTQGTAPALLKVSRLVLEGRAAMLRGQYRDAAKAFAKAADIEEAKPLNGYTDPPLWWYPVRRDVAAALLADGKADEAVAAADASLKRRPHDSIALATRAKAEDVLGKTRAADASTIRRIG